MAMISKRSQEGWLMIDHRASPGLTEADAVAAGLKPKLLAEGALYESATYTCRHCQRIVIMNPERTRERGFCRKCDAYICDECTAALSVGECIPFEKIADDVLNAAAKGQDQWQSGSSLLPR